MCGLLCARRQQRGLQKNELPAASGRQQRSISYKHMDRCFSEVMHHVVSAHRKRSWNSLLVSPTFFWNVEYMSALVDPVIMGLYGIMRRGFGFIKELGAVLVMTHWISVPTEPALWTFWQVEDQATIMRRAASFKQDCATELKQGRNVYKKLENPPTPDRGKAIGLRRDTRDKRSSTRSNEKQMGDRSVQS